MQAVSKSHASNARSLAVRGKWVANFPLEKDRIVGLLTAESKFSICGQPFLIAFFWHLMISKTLQLDQALAADLTEVDHARITRFTQFFSELQPILSAFLVTRTGGDPNAAGDCLQEVALVLWKKHEAGWTAEDFRRYAFRCADIEARSFRRRCHRQGKRIVYLAPDVIQDLGNETQEQIETDPVSSRRRLDALKTCLHGLDPAHRELLDARYEKDEMKKSVADISKERGIKMEALYKRLERIRTSLQNCILKRLNELQS
jgi:RNA polymerase sigma-70 factor (ECF subfamily)